MGISGRQLRFRRWLSYDPAEYCEIATSAYGLLAMTRQGGFPHPEGRNDKPESASFPCHCEEGASPTWQSREGTALRNEPSSKRQPPPTCHCEEAQPTWQSREGTSSSYKVPIKTYQPIASVAALSERLAGWQYSGHVFYGMRQIGRAHV